MSDSVIPLGGTEIEAMLDSADRHPSRNWRGRVGGTLVGALNDRPRRYPRRQVNFGMIPSEAHHIYDACRADRVTMACWLRRLVLAELRRRGLPDDQMPWLVASCAIPDQRHAYPPPEVRARREHWT